MTPDDASRSIGRHLFAGGLASLLLIGAVGGWGATTNLAGAVIASGHLVVDSHVKKVQHPTGGVVGEILIREGDHVAAGEVLMRLDATQTRANLAIITKRLDEFAARKARLEAERDDKEKVTFPASLLARIDNPDVAAAINSEKRLFAVRAESRRGKKAQLRERIAQYANEIDGLKEQVAAFNRGLEVLARELAGLRPLREKGYATVQRINSLDRETARLEGDRGEAIASQAEAAGRIAEAKLQSLQVDIDLKSEVARELREVEAQIGEYVERRIAAEDQLRRIDIIAPQSGIVHQLSVHTVGGVIAPADVILLIVPASDRLMLEAQIAPDDIDQIRVGQTALLRLSAFNRRTTPELIGTVNVVAADLTRNERTGQNYYLVRITIPLEQLRRLGKLSLVPGMPAEAFIKTGERTALSYLIKPLSDQITRAFRED